MVFLIEWVDKYVIGRVCVVELCVIWVVGSFMGVFFVSWGIVRFGVWVSVV